MLSHSSEKRSVMPGAIGEASWRSGGIKWALEDRKDLGEKEERFSPAGSICFFRVFPWEPPVSLSPGISELGIRLACHRSMRALE